ncbi:MAG: hypothetical protein DRI90_25905 [Deltaproteobacteria bacterium]|nr:MAG: hypothetical protein DRI90_25905 [Deltaproteobacteria bacterium]
MTLVVVVQLPPWSALLLLMALVACEPALPNRTPEGAVREFIEIVRGFHGNEEDARTLFELLSERAKQNLRSRADRYGAASGKKIGPTAMIVPSRMSPRFNPQAYSAQIVGKYALVDVVGVSAEQVAHVPCVFEEGLWRVDLVLPALPPMQHRPRRDR